MLSALIADPSTSVVYPVGGGIVVLFLTMMKMVWTVYTNGSKAETALRKTFADERTTRELEVTAEKTAAKAEYLERLAAHKDIHAREIAAFQSRITNYIEELTETKQRVAVLEAEVKELKTR